MGRGGYGGVGWFKSMWEGRIEVGFLNLMGVGLVVGLCDFMWIQN